MDLFKKIRSHLGDETIARAQDAAAQFVTETFTSAESSAPHPPPTGEPIEQVDLAQLPPPVGAPVEVANIADATQGVSHTNTEASAKAHVEQMLELNAMLRDGLITRAEFDSLKQQLLNQPPR